MGRVAESIWSSHEDNGARKQGHSRETKFPVHSTRQPLADVDIALCAIAFVCVRYDGAIYVLPVYAVKAAEQSISTSLVLRLVIVNPATPWGSKRARI